MKYGKEVIQLIRKRGSFIVYAIIGLAIIGITSQLITNPGALFKSILSTIVIGLLLFGIFYFFFVKRRHTTNEDKKYKQAVRQSQLKYDNHPSNPKKHNRFTTNKKRKNNASHLRVIEGKKGKNKNRATF